jgi:O-methyltransferase
MAGNSLGIIRKLTFFVYFSILKFYSTLVKIFLPRNINRTYYEGVIPSATYAPWNKDKSFLNCHSIIKEFTLVDKYKCFELWWLVEQTKKLEPGAYIEIGVWRGGSGALIAKKMDLCGIREVIYLCDTFQGVVKAGPKDSIYKGGEHSDTSEECVINLISRLEIGCNIKVLKGIFPEETQNLIADKAFRFCHVDVDVYDSAKDIVNWIWDKLVPGGVIIFDDYGHYSSEGIAAYVEEEKAKRKNLMVIHNLNGHALFIKI